MKALIWVVSIIAVSFLMGVLKALGYSNVIINVILFIGACSAATALCKHYDNKRALKKESYSPKKSIYRKYGETRGELYLGYLSELIRECGPFDDSNKTCIYDYSPSIYQKIVSEQGQDFANSFNFFFEKARNDDELIEELSNEIIPTMQSESVGSVTADTARSLSSISTESDSLLKAPSPIERSSSAVIERTDCESDFNKAKSLLIIPSQENINAALSIISGLAINNNYLPAVNWMAEYSENVLGDYKEAAKWYKLAAQTASTSTTTNVRNEAQQLSRSAAPFEQKAPSKKTKTKRTHKKLAKKLLLVLLAAALCFAFIWLLCTALNPNSPFLKREKKYSSDVPTNFRVYCDILSIEPVQRIKTSGGYKEVLCKCNSNGYPVWVYMTIKTYNKYFDPTAELSAPSGDVSEVKKIWLSPDVRIHGRIKEAEKICTGLSKGTSDRVIFLYSVDSAPAQIVYSPSNTLYVVTEAPSTSPAATPAPTALPAPTPEPTTPIYRVHLLRNGGTGGTEFVNVSFGDSMPKATAPSMKGYTFNGYYSEADGKGTKYYDADMKGVRKWDQKKDMILYASWKKKAEERYSSNSVVGDEVYVDIVSITPKYSITSGSSFVFYKFVCKCKTSSDKTVWLAISIAKYRELFDPSASNYGFNDGLKTITLKSKKRIHGVVKNPEEICVGLSEDIGNKCIDFSSMD